MATLHNLEETVLTVARSNAYRVRLQDDIREALKNYDAQDQLKVEPLTPVRPESPLADYFFKLHDYFTNWDVGFIFPFRRTAIACTSQFADAMDRVLSPQGYDILRYTHHRGPSDAKGILHFLTSDNFGSRLERWEEAEIRLLG